MNNLPPPTPGEGERGGEAVKPNQFLKLTAIPPAPPGRGVKEPTPGPDGTVRATP